MIFLPVSEPDIRLLTLTDEVFCAEALLTREKTRKRINAVLPPLLDRKAFLTDFSFALDFDESEKTLKSPAKCKCKLSILYCFFKNVSK